MQTLWEIMALSTAGLTELCSASQYQTPSSGPAAPAAELGCLKLSTGDFFCLLQCLLLEFDLLGHPNH